MVAILKKEINSFFSSPIGYLVIAIYLIMSGLFLWVFNDNFNILNAGFADLTSYFFLAPWFLIFLIPAITMRSFSDEYNAGTIEILKTKPISDWGIILGKYLASLILIITAILPTIVYVYSIYELSNPIGNIDFGSIIGSYIGLLFLASSFSAIGIYTSTLTKNQIVSFIISIFISFFLFYGFEGLANYNLFGNMDYVIQQIGMNEHFKSISRGVIDSRDLIYFISITLFFLVLTNFRLKNE
ncbi:gliding motility-associated ABC transporter permease subunit GldF [Aureivirga sp. CE67]|uniref:gliding motility-associated ABC transporter permease subunit GldF n=1 Tax=Aureivirga sp. CE67 TaxID=1788983 RepID=UPI0018CB5DF1|nr:gliding motility-associated ABC transporter permease subunit GldF [Aureivirga sp. CE67]